MYGVVSLWKAEIFARIRNQLKITNDLLDNYKEYYEGEDDEQK